MEFNPWKKNQLHLKIYVGFCVKLVSISVHYSKCKEYDYKFDCNTKFNFMISSIRQ